MREVGGRHCLPGTHTRLISRSVTSLAPAMSTYTIAESAVIAAPAPRCYAIVADYREGHPRIVPPRVFGPLVVEEGGVGAGTRVRFTMRIMGIERELVTTVTEPEPGRVLVEVIKETGAVTSFIFDPLGDATTRVTIQTVFPIVRGVQGAIERWITQRLLGGGYR